MIEINNSNNHYSDKLRKLQDSSFKCFELVNVEAQIIPPIRNINDYKK